MEALMGLDQLVAEIEGILLRQPFSERQETISLLTAVTRELASRLDRQDAARSALQSRIAEEAPRSCTTFRDHPARESTPARL